MLRGVKILTEYILSIFRVFLVFTIALFLPWAFLYQVQTCVVDGKANMRIVQNDQCKERVHPLKKTHS